MKKLIFSLGMIALVMLASAQIPNNFNYQAVIRNSNGAVRSNTPVTMEFRIYDTGSGGALVFEEVHNTTTNEIGLVNVVIGEFSPLDIAWTEGPYTLEVTVDDVLIGSDKILAVPFALAAATVADKDDADADPTNEIQDLQLVENVLSITGNPEATPITLPGAGNSQWILDGDSLTIINKNVGIGTTSPTGRLVVMGTGTEAPEEPLFEVKKADGQTVFAVYNDGAEVYVNENPVKGIKGGFAVGGYNSGKAFTNEYLRVTSDSVRIYVDDNPSVKGIKGGFAVGGYNSGKGTTTDFMYLTSDNYFIGHQSGLKITTGVYNSTLGYMAGTGLTTGSENIFLGYQSGFNNTEGYQNTFLGYQAGFNNTTGFQNSFLGYRSGHANTTGHNNLFLGYESGYSNTSGTFNMFLGYRAGALNTTGESNMFIGLQSGRLNTTGSRNLFIGPAAGFENVDGSRNIFIGYMAGNNNVSGSSNLFFGEYAGFTNTEGFYNIFIGTSSGSSNTSGSRNIFVGDQSGAYNTTGYNNTFLGYQSGYNLKDGTGNLFLGYEAGFNSNGSENVYLGSMTGKSNKGSGNIFIGKGAGGLEDSISNRLIIDNTIGITAEDALIYGKLDYPRELKFTANVGIGRIPAANNLEVEGTASKTTAGEWFANSDMRIKTEIRDLEDAYNVMLKLRPVSFRYTEEYIDLHPQVEDRPYYNFLAQEYREVFPESVQSSGEMLESAHDEILQMDSYNAQIYAIKAVQDLIIENQQQKAQIEELYEMINQLKKEMEK